MTPSPPSDLVHHVAPPAVVLDADGRIVDANAAWAGGTPASARQGVAVGAGTDYLAVVRRSAERGDVDAGAVQDVLEDVLAGRSDHGHVDYPCPSPTAHRWFRLTAVGLGDGHALLLHTPTTAPRADRGPELSDDAAHDLTRPVDTARGLVMTLLERGDQLTPGTRDDALKAAHRQLDHALGVLADLGGQPTLPDVVGPRPVRVAAVAREAAETAGLTCRLEGDTEVAVRCDPGHLDRVLANLCSNAAKYGEPPVVVSLARRGLRVELTVADHGPGIPADMAGRLFVPDQRGWAHQRADLPGSGLGLAIVRDLLRVNGGTIVHDADLPGAGFRIDLPAAPPEAVPA